MRGAVVITTCALVLVGLVATNAAPRIGVASAIKNNVTGTIGGSFRTLNSGDAVFQNEVVSTAAASSAQLLFRDETSMTVGPNSEVKLDKFVYNPSTKSGEIVFNVTKGAFRFVSGSAKSNTYKIKTPVATIGVKGTIIEGYLIWPGPSLVLVLVEGAFTACTSSGCTTVTEPGTYIVIDSSGNTSQPATWTGDTLDILQDNDGGFEQANQVRPLGRFGDPLPRSGTVNDALDNKGVGIRFPRPPEPEVDLREGYPK